MVTKNKVGRPPKMFKPKPKENIIRSRGRPRKHSEKQKTFPQLEEIKKIPISFINNNIKKKSKIDNIALGLLVFSILLFIFSMLFASRNRQVSQEAIQQNNDTLAAQETTLAPEVDAQILANTGTQIPTPTTNEVIKLTVQEQLISDFYKTINAKNFDNLINLTDIPLRQSNTYKTYYNATRLTNFLNSVSNNTIYITDIKEIPNTLGKAKKYQYTLKYKLKSDNILFTEERNASIVYKNDKNLIGSIMCINKGCSQNPFFNPKKY
ncbi:MAG: hypothetical protein WAU85_00990 [Candidatus Absconditicoccaceae bacterium]